MPSIFENAIASMRMGVEDFKQQDQDRDISAVRNFYAGILLLAKEALIRATPNGDPEIVIAAKIKPVPDGQGGVAHEKVGHGTVDFVQICDRAKDFGINIDKKSLQDLNNIRNDMEHYYTKESSASIRAAISKCFTVAASLFHQLGENPIAHLEGAWTTMLETKDLYEHQLKEAKQTFSEIKWYSPKLQDLPFKCKSCKSEIIEQLDPENNIQEYIEFHCRTCGEKIENSDMIEFTLDELFGGDAYTRAKEGMDSGPIFECPVCNKNTLIEEELSCANCGEEIDYTSECIRCTGGISLEDYLGGLDEGLCSWCAHMSQKIRDE